MKEWGYDTQQETRSKKREKETSVFEVKGKDSEPLNDTEKDYPKNKTRRQPSSLWRLPVGQTDETWGKADGCGWHLRGFSVNLESTKQVAGGETGRRQGGKQWPPNPFTSPNLLGCFKNTNS